MMIKKYVKLVLFFAVFFVFSACATLLTDDDLAQIDEYENGTYILKKDLFSNDGQVLKKGERVKLLSSSTDEYVKLYAYSAKETLLESHRFLMVYLFSDSFPIQENERGEKQKVMNEMQGYDQLGREGYEKYLADQKRSVDSSKFRFSKEKLEVILKDYIEPAGK